jgi:putative protease
MEGNTMDDAKKIGEVTHFFPNISVAVVNPSAPIKLGDSVKICDKEGNVVVEQEISSMQIDRKDIESADAGVEFAMKVEGQVKEGYMVCAA